MNGKLFKGSVAIIFLLAACTPLTTTIPDVTLVASETPSPIPTYTSLPTETATPTITPLPTIPTFTLTFDASTIVTVTPAPKVECPEVDAAVRPEKYFPGKLIYPSSNHESNKVLEYLNKGGSGNLLFERLGKVYPEMEFTGGYDFRDVTGDQIPEFLYIEFTYGGQLLIFSCKDGTFEQFAALSGDHDDHAYSLQIEDLNMDGLAEVLLIGAFCGSFCHDSIYIYDWNGQSFAMISKVQMAPIRQMSIRDFDGDGMKEIIVAGGNPYCLSCSNFIPQRERTVVYGWNGKGFVEFSNQFSPSEYRFQAIQDADAQANLGKYDAAIKLYEEVISNQALEWWSPERLEYEQALADSWIPDLTLPPEPLEDETEYPRLAAYAYYRIMLLHFVQGKEQEANRVYSNLQEILGSSENAQPYIEMATRFLNSYQSHQEIYDGCRAAIEYAAEDPEILTPLGSEYHGWQSHTYAPADICPFR